MKIASIILTIASLANPAFGQTIYKCPDPSGVVKFSQIPCQGSEAITINASKSGADGLRDSERAYLDDREKYRKEAARNATSSTGGEIEAECIKLKKRVLELEHRAHGGVHTYTMGEDDAELERKRYEELCQ